MVDVNLFKTKIEKSLSQEYKVEFLGTNFEKIVNLLLREGKAMFQSELMNKLGIGKVKTTRLLDKLESKQLIERKRQGLNNIVLLKG